MAETTRWKVAVFVALGVAAAGWIRARHGVETTAVADETSSSDRASESPCERPARSRETEIRLGDRFEERAARLSHAITPRSVCDAFVDLSRMHDPRAARAIASGVRARHDTDSRRCGIEALAEIGSAPAVARLVDFVDDDDPRILRAVFAGLARSGIADAVTLVRSAAASERGEQRHAALLGLGAAHRRESAGLIATALATAVTANERRELLGALGSAGDPAEATSAIPYLRDPDRPTRDAACDALGLLDGDEAVAALTEILRTGNVGDASSAAHALAHSHLPAARAALFEAVAWSGPVAEHAAEALAGLEGSDVETAMAAMLAGEDAHVLATGIAFVEARHDLGAVARLAELADDPRETIAERAVEALAAQGDDSARDALFAIASRPGDARIAALSRLVADPGTHDRAIDLAIRLVRDEGGAMASETLDVLAHDGSTAARDVMFQFARGHGALVTDAIGHLGERRDAESLRVLEDLARAPAEADDGSQANVLAHLGRRATAGSEGERIILAFARAGGSTYGSIEALRNLVTPSSASAMLEIARSPAADEWVRIHALETVAAMPGSHDVAAIEALTQSESTRIAYSAMRVLSATAPTRVAEHAVEWAHSPVSTVRVSGVAALRMLDPAVATPMLAAALTDPDPEVARVATAILARIGGVDAQQALASAMSSSATSAATRQAAATALAQSGGAIARAQRPAITRVLAEDTVE